MAVGYMLLALKVETAVTATIGMPAFSRTGMIYGSKVENPPTVATSPLDRLAGALGSRVGGVVVVAGDQLELATLGAAVLVHLVDAGLGADRGDSTLAREPVSW